MLELLLKQNELDSIHLLQKMLYYKPCSLEMLEVNLLKDKTTIKRKIKDLNAIFKLIGYPNLTIVVKKGELLLVNFDSQQHNNLLIDICSFFITESPVAAVIKALLDYPNVSQEKILANIYISESYLNKIINKINHFLKPAQVIIISRKKNYYFSGPPINWLFINFLTRHFPS